jgi:hypothetical protein
MRDDIRNELFRQRARRYDQAFVDGGESRTVGGVISSTHSRRPILDRRPSCVDRWPASRVHKRWTMATLGLEVLR